MKKKKRKNILINKETGKEISNLINKIEPETVEKILIRNQSSNSLSSIKSDEFHL